MSRATILAIPSPGAGMTDTAFPAVLAHAIPFAQASTQDVGAHTKHLRHDVGRFGKSHRQARHARCASTTDL